MCQRFYSILVCTHFRYVYHVTETVQVVLGIHCCWWCGGSLCSDTFCIALLRV